MATRAATGPQLALYKFPFENLVFEGGSNKLLAYCGVIRVLEETGILKQIERFGGTGLGAVLAVLCSVGYDSRQLEELFQDDLRNLTRGDVCLGSCCVGCRLATCYGIRTNKKVSTWIGTILKEFAGNADITFAQLHKRFRKEVAVAVTDVRKGCVELCHLKTTPHLPIRQAVRMSLAAPGLCQPVKQRLHSAADIYVQGGVTCNYPIHCFDGWWLSLKLEDAFIKRIENLDEISKATDDDYRFGVYNNRTIGIIVFDDTSRDGLAVHMSGKTKPANSTTTSGTLLRGIRLEATKETEALSREYSQIVQAANKLIQLIETKDAEITRVLDRKYINDMLTKGVLTEGEWRILFGSKPDADTILHQISQTGSGDEVTFGELLGFCERRRRSVEAQFTRDVIRPIDDVAEYFEALNETFEKNNRGLCIKRRDLERTVGVSIGHIRSSDRGETLEKADRLFMVQRGQQAMRTFLDQFVSRTSHAKPGRSTSKEEEEEGEDARRSFCRDDLHLFIDDDVSEIIDAKDYMETYLEKIL